MHDQLEIDPLTIIAGRLEPITAHAPTPAADRLSLGLAMDLALEDWPDAKTFLRECGRADAIADLQARIDTMNAQPKDKPANFAAMEAARLLILDLKREAASIATAIARKSLLATNGTPVPPASWRFDLQPLDRRLFKYLEKKVDHQETFQNLADEVWENPQTTQNAMVSAKKRVNKILFNAGTRMEISQKDGSLILYKTGV